MIGFQIGIPAMGFLGERSVCHYSLAGSVCADTGRLPSEAEMGL